RAVLSEDSDGVDSIDGDNDRLKKTGNVTINCRMGRFDAVPGTVIKLFDMGLWDGRWLVTTVERDIFNPLGTITLKKPDPRFTNVEPLNDPSNFGGSSQTDLTAAITQQQTGNDQTPFFQSTGCLETIIQAHTLGTYADRNQQQMGQWQKALRGEKLSPGSLTNDPGGSPVALNPKVPCFIASLLDMGYHVGTYAICEDHDYHTDTGNVSNHSNASAVDVEALSKVGDPIGLTDPKTKALTIEVMELAIKFGADQVIMNGNGSTDADVQKHQWNHGSYQGGTWVDDHLNHIHVSFPAQT
ncbi:MAG TPA: hypothetical protein VGE97_10775, partial [Nitrososphaera sp.]